MVLGSMEPKRTLGPVDQGGGSGESIQLMSVRDLMTRLIPWMHREKVTRVRLGIMHETQEIGSIIVEHTNRTTIVGEPNVSLFPGKGPRRTFFDWGREKFRRDMRQCTFVATALPDVPLKPAAAQTQQLIEEPDFPIGSGLDFDADPETEQYYTILARALIAPGEAAKPKSPKPPRAPRPKRETKSERRERIQRAIDEETKSALDTFNTSVKLARDLRDVHENLMRRITEACNAFAQFLNDKTVAHAARALVHLKSDPRYESANLALGMAVLITDPIRAKDRDSMLRRDLRAQLSAQRGLAKFIEKLYPRNEQITPFYAHDRRMAYKEERTIHDYHELLFADFPSRVAFLEYLESLGDEHWIDIGSGNTYQIESSLMNEISVINPKVRIDGLDPQYAGHVTSIAGKLLKDTDIQRNGAAKHNLIEGTAQTIPESRVPDESRDTALACWVFDKFNETVGGTEQALRQLARILKPGGKARIFPLREYFVDSPVLQKYFTIEWKASSEAATLRHEPSFSAVAVVLKRKEWPSDEAEAREAKNELKKEIRTWIQTHAPEHLE